MLRNTPAMCSAQAGTADAAAPEAAAPARPLAVPAFDGDGDGAGITQLGPGRLQRQLSSTLKARFELN
jgi:hypothetical protein